MSNCSNEGLFLTLWVFYLLSNSYQSVIWAVCCVKKVVGSSPTCSCSAFYRQIILDVEEVADVRVRDEGFGLGV